MLADLLCRGCLVEEIEQEVTISVDAEPFKYKKEVTVVKDMIFGEKAVICMNDRMEVVPSIKSSTECTAIFNGNIYVVSKNTGRYPDIVFKRGENVLQIVGTTEIEITYREGAL